MEITPCEKCTIKEGYGGDYRCWCCELSKLREENEQLKKKIAKLKAEKRQYRFISTEN